MIYINKNGVKHIDTNTLLQSFLNGDIIYGAEVYCIMPVEFLETETPDYFGPKMLWKDAIFLGGDSKGNFSFSKTKDEVCFLLSEEPTPNIQSKSITSEMLFKHIDYLWNRKFSPRSNIITRSLKAEI